MRHPSPRRVSGAVSQLQSQEAGTGFLAAASLLSEACIPRPEWALGQDPRAAVTSWARTWPIAGPHPGHKPAAQPGSWRRPWEGMLGRSSDLGKPSHPSLPRTASLSLHCGWAPPAGHPQKDRPRRGSPSCPALVAAFPLGRPGCYHRTPIGSSAPPSSRHPGGGSKKPGAQGR